jgi:hypothetical protein
MKGKHLAIEIADHAVRFVCINDEVVMDISELSFNNKTKEEKIKKLELHLKKEGFLQGDFDEVTLSWSAQRSTIVPKSIFNEATPDSIFELCYGKDAMSNEIDFNRIAELNIVNIFEIFDWVKQFFTVKFPRITIQHEGSHLIRKILTYSGSKLQVVAILYRGYFQLIIVNQNNLKFYSSFDYQSYEDVIYHLLFTLQQQQLTNQNGSIHIISGVGENKSIHDDVVRNIGRVKDLRELKFTSVDYLVAKSQLLCV